MKLYPFILAACLPCYGLCQVTPADMEAMQKRLQHLRDSMLNDPKLKKYAGDQSGFPVSRQDNVNENFSSGRIEKIKLPGKDTAALRRLSQNSFSPAQLHLHIQNIQTALRAMLPADAVQSASGIARKLENDAQKIATVAMLALQNGAWEEAVWLATHAAVLSPHEINLTNAGAILDMAGLSEAAIPILKTVVTDHPDNPAAWNNLGQAYVALGQQDSGMYYCGGSIKLSPQHPEANNTAGMIELANGNSKKAQSYFENSIRGGFNMSAYKGLRTILKENCRVSPLIKPKVKLPEYANEFKYHLPRQCENVLEAAVRNQEQAVFRKEIAAAIQQYQRLGKEAEVKMKQTSAAAFNESMMNKAMNGERVLRPFQVLGGVMEAESILAYNKDISDLVYFNKQNRRQYDSLTLQYKKAFDQLLQRYAGDDKECCGEGDVSCCDDAENFCREGNELKNKYLPLFAQLNSEWQSRNLLIEKTHLDNFLFWGNIAALNRNDFRVRFYQRITHYLQTLQRLNIIKILEPCYFSKEESENEEQKDSTTIEEPLCPGVSIRFLIGKLDGDCEKISFKAGDGFAFRYERNFLLRQQTISFGVGKDIDKLEIKALGLEAGLDFEASFSAYVTFDLQGNVTDGGLLAKVKGKAGAGFETGQKLKFKDGISLQAGISSGVAFEPGPLKPLWDKLKSQPEQPVNPKVKIYKSNQ